MLVTLDDWPKYTDLPAPPNAEGLLAAASANIVDYCGWPIAKHTVEGEEYDGPGGTILTLHTLKLVSVEQVRVDGEPIAGYRVSRKLGQLGYPPGWPRGFGRIQVDYTAGFDPVPANIAQLAVGLAAGGAAVPVGVGSETVDRVTIRYREATRLTAWDQITLSAYTLGPRP